MAAMKTAAGPGKNFRQAYADLQVDLQSFAHHAVGIEIIFLAEIIEWLIAVGPVEEPATGPRGRVSARIVHRNFIAQLVERRPRNAFGQV